MMGTFVALDMFLFYVFWEVMLLPMYFLIGIWGGPRKEYAAIKFFLYTLAGSVLMLLAIIAHLLQQPGPRTLADGTPTPHTFNLLELAEHGARRASSPAPPPILGLRLHQDRLRRRSSSASPSRSRCSRSTPGCPTPTSRRPRPISVILAGVLLKMGIYGILRFNYADPARRHRVGGQRPSAVFGVINIVYAAFVCLAQKDLKKLIAYSSVSHMGFCLLGMAAMTPQGISGAVLQHVHPRHHQPDALPHRRRDLRPRPPPRDRAASAAWPRCCPSTPAIIGLAFFASLGLPGPGRLRRRVPGLLGRLPGLHGACTVDLGHRGHHHRRLLPVDHPAHVPGQAQPDVQRTTRT